MTLMDTKQNIVSRGQILQCSLLHGSRDYRAFASFGSPSVSDSSPGFSAYKNPRKTRDKDREQGCIAVKSTLRRCVVLRMGIVQLLMSIALFLCALLSLADSAALKGERVDNSHIYLVAMIIFFFLSYYSICQWRSSCCRFETETRY